MSMAATAESSSDEALLKELSIFDDADDALGNALSRLAEELQSQRAEMAELKQRLERSEKGEHNSLAERMNALEDAMLTRYARRCHVHSLAFATPAPKPLVDVQGCRRGR